MKKNICVCVICIFISTIMFLSSCSFKPVLKDSGIDNEDNEEIEKKLDDTVLDIKGNRQVLWDDYCVDTNATNAKLCLNKPTMIEQPVFTFDKPWEGDSCDYFCIIDIPQEDGSTVYRMYYNGWSESGVIEHGLSAIKICAIESKDGINWYRPDYGLFSYEGIDNTNIVMMTEDGFDNFFVFIDTNPNCPAEQKYKAVSEYLGQDDYGQLYGYTSADGLHWTLGSRLASTADGTFDSVNTCFYNSGDGNYYLYFRGFHDADGDGVAETRDIRMKKSPFFDSFSASSVEMLQYNDKNNFALYTNNAMPYYRALDTILSIPTRYNDHNITWTENYDNLPDVEQRKQRYKENKRYATVTTDALFMTSHNGVDFSRFSEAFATAGAEHTGNWIYGDCYFAYGMIQTPTEFDNQDKVLSLYSFEGKYSKKPSRLYRWVIRTDGFASYQSGYEPSVLTTKAFTFEGDNLNINFKTSGAGSIIINILDENGNKIDGYESYEIFGDKIDRNVMDVSSLKGQKIRLQFTMSDAEIYSFIFQ